MAKKQMHTEFSKRNLNDRDFLENISLTQYCTGGKTEENETGGARGAYGGGEKGAQGVGGET
jgi:hypothetical protein